MMLLRTPTPTQSFDQASGFRSQRKRKAETPPENNERLSKRLSLLNLEQNGAKIYVPVENPVREETSSTSYSSPPRNVPHQARAAPSVDELMQVDDTKHKVYIYNLDDELASESDSDDKDKVIFLPDIEKHLRSSRIPSQILANPQDLADMQLVLYSVPSSISVPEERDSVRKAILEARARLREKQENESESAQSTVPTLPAADVGVAPDVPPSSFPQQQDSDPDAMEID
ncbi:hypothetical protein DL546_000556 [Coniochaeta pulveracea]|uniref:Uncharacterized protein n=1 Tax=Coniochaeta pulveracea TaxID=177199 RepID=A0A420XYF2_9PEZI|nr:hypothetical protein DL546_000556 [Coniochaeta pulveracea]